MSADHVDGRLARGSNLDWDRYKEIIIHYYVEEDKTLQGDDGVIRTMENRYRFSATKAQFQRRFKYWGVQKNQRGKDWEKVVHKLNAREQAGKSSEVWLNGQLLKQEKVSKERSRYGVSAHEWSQRVFSPTTPGGFRICTPTPQCSMQHATYNLPCFQLEAVFRFKAMQQQTVGIPTNLANAGRSNASWHTDSSASFVSLGSPSETMPPEIFHPIHYQLASCFSQVVIPALEALLPPGALCQTPRQRLGVLPSNELMSSTHAKLPIFAMANNFAGLDDLLPKKMLFEYLKSNLYGQLSQFIRLNTGSASAAVVDKLFWCAIDEDDADVVETLLNGRFPGISANDPFCIINGEKLNPTHRSCQLQNTAVTKVLIRYHADVNANIPGHATSRTPDKEEEVSPLQIALGDVASLSWCRVREFQRVRDIDTELILALVNGGAREHIQILLENSSSVPNAAKLVETMILAGIKDNDDEWSQTGVFCAAVKLLDHQAAVSIVNAMLQVGTDINHSVQKGFGRSVRDNPVVKTVLDAAAWTGNLDLARLLLQNGAMMTSETLSCAAACRNFDLFDLMLDAKTSFNGTFTTFGNEDRIYISEIIRAIDEQNTEAIEYFYRRLGLSDMQNVRDVEATLNRLALLKIQDCWRLDSSEMALEQQKILGFEIMSKSAIHVGDIERISLLLQVDLPVHYPEGNLPRNFITKETVLGRCLLEAIRAERDEVSYMLLGAGADVNPSIHFVSQACWWREGNILEEALKRRNSSLVRAILDADVHLSSLNVLVEAIVWGDISIVKGLIYAGARLNSSGCDGTPLQIAVREDKPDIVQVLLEAGADVNQPSAKSALAEAFTGNKTDEACRLLSVGADPADTEAFLAAMSKSPELLDLLIKEFSRRYPRGKNGFGGSVLLKAIQTDDLKLLQTLLAAPNDTALAWAIRNDKRKAVEMLIDYGAEPDSAVSDSFPGRNTALLVAIEAKNVPLTEPLIRRGAKLNLQTTLGVKRTPLQQAAEVGSIEVVRLLLRDGAEVNAAPADRGGATALQLAAIRGYIGIAFLLLERGANVNAPTAKVHGRTALESAAEHGRIDMVQFLLDAGSSLTGRERRLAQENGHMATAELIRLHLSQQQSVEGILTSGANEPVEVPEVEAPSRWSEEIPWEPEW